MTFNLSEYCLDVARRAKKASRELASTPGSVKNAWLRRVADLLQERESDLLKANALDLEAGRAAGPVSYTHLTLPTICSV